MEPGGSITESSAESERVETWQAARCRVPDVTQGVQVQASGESNDCGMRVLQQPVTWLLPWLGLRLLPGSDLFPA